MHTPVHGRDDSDDHETDSSDSESEPEEDGRDQQLAQRLDDAVNEIIENKNDFTKADKPKLWFEKYNAILDSQIDHKGNILHRLLESNAKDKDEHITSALEALATQHPRLLKQHQTRDNGRTPIFIAVLQSKPRMVSAMIRGLRGSGAVQQKVKESVSNSLVENETCLHLAIRTKLKESAVQDLLSIAPQFVLGHQDNDGRTPLHHAVRYHDCGIHKRFETVREMLRMASPESLIKQDHLGRSLFLYHMETANQFDEVEKQRQKETVRRDEKENPRVQEIRTDSIRVGDNTVEMDEGRMPGLPDDPRSNDKQPSRLAKADPKTEVSKRDYRSGSKRGAEATKAAEKGGRSNEAISHAGDGSERLVRSNQSAHREPALSLLEPHNTSRNSSPKGARGQHCEKDDAWKNLIEKKREWLNSKKEEKETIPGPAKERKEKLTESTRESKKRGGTDRMDPQRLKDRSKKIKLEIKLSCMRKMSPMETNGVIYGENPADVQTYFDLPYSPTAVSLRMLETSFRDVNFDSVLQYVAFPSVTIEQKSEELQTSYISAGAGKKDMVQVFKWLREKKNVERIMKVIVDDSREPAHSDEAIIGALDGFRIEELHWLKTDLDPETIRLTSGKTVRELYLRWSGNNTVLRGWGESEGISKLENLSTVYIDLVPELNLESDAQTKKNFHAFKKRLNPSSPNRNDVAEQSRTTGAPVAEAREITVKLLKRGGLYSPGDRRGDSVTAAGIARLDQNHQWLDHMDVFAQEMSGIWEHAIKVPIPPPLQYLRKPVTVALIDDGVDIIDPSFHGLSYGGQSLSFDLIGETQLKTSQRGHPYYHSKAGHGTVMANMIFRVCPMAKLYIIRIETHRDAEGNISIVPGSAAKAIETAIARDVNIISMSWTITADPSKDSKEKKEIATAVTRAYEKGISMFCTSNDGGHFAKDTYPAFGNQTNLFRIGAANADGTPFSWAGSVQDLDYILPGVDVVKRRPGYRGGQLLKEKLGKMESNTGSSVATALAAGLAAMILTCAKITAVHMYDPKAPGKVPIDESAIQLLQSHTSMKAALDNLDLTPNKYIQVWKSLDTSRFSDSHVTEKLRAVAQITLTRFFKTIRWHSN